jgi:hypothetical protein
MKLFYSPSSVSSSSAASPRIPFVANINIGPKVCPESVDIATGTSAVSLVPPTYKYIRCNFMHLILVDIMPTVESNSGIFRGGAE